MRDCMMFFIMEQTVVGWQMDVNKHMCESWADNCIVPITRCLYALLHPVERRTKHLHRLSHGVFIHPDQHHPCSCTSTYTMQTTLQCKTAHVTTIYRRKHSRSTCRYPRYQTIFIFEQNQVASVAVVYIYSRSCHTPYLKTTEVPTYPHLLYWKISLYNQTSAA